MSKRIRIIFIGLAGAIVVIGIAYGGLLFKNESGQHRSVMQQKDTIPDGKTNTQQPIFAQFSDWIVYENQKYRYRIKHPADLKLDGDEEKMTIGDPRWQTYTIIIMAYPAQGLGLMEWVKTKPGFGKETLSRASNTNVGGYPGVEICNWAKPDLNYCYVFIKKDDLIFWMNFAFYTKDIEAISRFYKEAISSFSFF